VTGLRYLMGGGAWDRRSNVHICLITLNKMVLLLHYKCFASFILYLMSKYAQIKQGSPCTQPSTPLNSHMAYNVRQRKKSTSKDAARIDYLPAENYKVNIV
jgi:hypothetical protein